MTPTVLNFFYLDLSLKTDPARSSGHLGNESPNPFEALGLKPVESYLPERLGMIKPVEARFISGNAQVLAKLSAILSPTGPEYESNVIFVDSDGVAIPDILQCFNAIERPLDLAADTGRIRSSTDGVVLFVRQLRTHLDFLARRDSPRPLIGDEDEGEYGPTQLLVQIGPPATPTDLAGFAKVATSHPRKLGEAFHVIDEKQVLSRETIEGIIVAIEQSSIPFGPPEIVGKMPPSRWGMLSLRKRFFDHRSRYRFVQPIRAEFTTRTDAAHFHHVFETSCARWQIFEPEHKNLVNENLIYVLRTARLLATKSLEGEPFHCTVLITPKKDRELTAILGKKWISCYCPQIAKLFNEDTKNIAEVAQSESLFFLIDPQDARFSHLISRPDSDEDYCRMAFLRKLARQTQGLAVHMRDTGLVELYDQDDMQLWFDGYRWIKQPFELARQWLRFFFGHQSPLVDRMVGALASLLDRHNGTILIFEKDARTSLLEKKDGESFLEPTRPELVKDLAEPTRQDRFVKEIPLDAFLAFLRIDGAHVINEHGHLSKLAYRVVDNITGAGGEKEQGGTGRLAAQSLSKRIGPPGFVVKVSASRKITVYSHGEINPFPSIPRSPR